MIAYEVINLIRKISPIVGSALAGPLGTIIGSLISKTLGGINMNNVDEVSKSLQDPESIQKLKSIEPQILDVQNARIQASKDTGLYKLVRPILFLVAMMSIVVDIYFIQFLNNILVDQILILMLILLVFDIRQIYKFYFGRD